MNQITLLVTVILGGIGAVLFLAQMPLPALGFAVLAVLTFFSLKMANNWERFVILRAGKLSSVKGPGLFVIIPIIDAITAWGERYLPDAIPTCASGDGACLAELPGEGPMNPVTCAP